MSKIKIDIKSINSIKELLQEAYRLADEQIVQAQLEITKLSNATKLQDEIMDAKSKYSKAISDYLSIKDKAISKKIEIAKLLTEIYKHDGDVGKTFNDKAAMSDFSFDFKKIRDIVNNNDGESDKTERIELKYNK